MRGERGRGGHMIYRVEGSGLFDVIRGEFESFLVFFFLFFSFPSFFHKFIWGVKARGR